MTDSFAAMGAASMLNGDTNGAAGFSTSMHSPPAPMAQAAQSWPLPPKPDGFWPKTKWQAKRVWRFLCLRVWPVILTVIDFVLRRTTVGFLFRPMDGSGN